jgi:hypothetical protein
MTNYEECRRHAEECVKWAATAKDQRAVPIYLEMAECWLRLAINADDCPQLANARVPATNAATRNGSTNVLQQWIVPQTGSLIEKSCS